MFEVEWQKTMVAAALTSTQAKSATLWGSSTSRSLQQLAITIADISAKVSRARKPHALAAPDAASDAPSQQLAGHTAGGTPAVVAAPPDASAVQQASPMLPVLQDLSNEHVVAAALDPHIATAVCMCVVAYVSIYSFYSFMCLCTRM